MTQIALWLIAINILLIPFTTLVSWPTTYGIYFLDIISLWGLGIYLNNFPKLGIFWPILLRWLVWLLVFIFYITAKAPASLTNLGAIFVAELAILALASYQGTRSGLTSTFRVVLATCLIMIPATVFGSYLLSLVGLAANPFVQFQISGRLVALSPTIASKIYGHSMYGHSCLMYLSAIVLILCTSNVIRMSHPVRLLVISFALITSALTAAAVSYLATLSILLVASIEYLFRKPARANAVHVAMILSLLFIVSNEAYFEEALAFFRYQLLHKEASLYGHDLTSGRALLNKIMWDGALDKPWFGNGHDSPLLQYGTAVVLGETGVYNSLVESPIRVAAKYGLPFFVFLGILIISPLRNLSSNEKSVRIYSVSTVYATLSFLSANSVLEVPHAYEYFLLLLMTLLALRMRGAEMCAATPKTPVREMVSAAASRKRARLTLS